MRLPLRHLPLTTVTCMLGSSASAPCKSWAWPGVGRKANGLPKASTKVGAHDRAVDHGVFVVCIGRQPIEQILVRSCVSVLRHAYRLIRLFRKPLSLGSSSRLSPDLFGYDTSTGSLGRVQRTPVVPFGFSRSRQRATFGGDRCRSNSTSSSVPRPRCTEPAYRSAPGRRLAAPTGCRYRRSHPLLCLTRKGRPDGGPSMNFGPDEAQAKMKSEGEIAGPNRSVTLMTAFSPANENCTV